MDGVQLAILTSRMQSVARAMMNTLQRTARSGVINTARDFSCCVLTRDDELLATAESLPIHVMRGPDIMAKAMKQFHPHLKRGDAFLHNSPYHGNSHAADLSILVPVVEDGQHRFTLLVKAHQADIGNSIPTTYVAGAKDVYNEGALIFAATQVQENYVDKADIIRLCMMRIRVPEQWWGDYSAMIGAARIGEREICKLAAEVGWEQLYEYIRRWFDYSEQMMIQAIKPLPSGDITVYSRHDPFPGVPEGIPVKASVRIDQEAATIAIDLRDNVECQPCGLNLTEGTSLTAAMIAIYNSIGASVPVNSGSFRRIKVLLKENCAVGIPRHPASCSVATTNLADHVTNPIQRGLAELCEGYGMAEAGWSMPPAWGVLSGHDTRYGLRRAFINQILLPSATGGAGGPHTDGWLTIGHVGNSGMMLRDSVEVDEIKHPIIIEEQAIIPDSEGAGRRRGAPGAMVRFGPTSGSIAVAYTSDGNISPALGARGGGAGATSRQVKVDRSGALHTLDACSQVTLEKGEYIISYSCGGGGYGLPTDREVGRVLHDIQEGYITAKRASDVYGVILADDGTVDASATRKRRENPPYA